MITTNSRMSDLEAFCQENAFTLREGMEEILMMFYEAAGFRKDVLETEILSMSDDKLMEAYTNL